MIELVNDHVLFPELANWFEKPLWQRRWQTEISSAVTGAESRIALRAEPRASLTWLVTPVNMPDQAIFDDQIRAAKEGGFACAPYAGRAFILQGDVDADTAGLDRDWPGTFALFVLFITSSGLYEVREVAAAGTDTITLDQAVARTYAAGTFCWPLIFGKFTCEDMPARSPAYGPLKITIEELVSPASEQLGEVVADTSEGIGSWAVGPTLEVQ